MKKFINLNFWIYLVILLAACQFNLNAQDPCEPMECCLELDDITSQTLGTLPTLDVDPSNPWYDVYGSFPAATIVAQGCGTLQSIEISAEVAQTGLAGSSAGYTDITPSTPTFIEGREYCITFDTRVDSPSGAMNIDIRLKAVNSTPIAYACNGNCTIINDWPLDTNPDECETHTINWVADNDYQNAVFAATSLDNDGDPSIIHIDNVCIEEKIGAECMAEFELESIDQDCGEYCFKNLSCGEGLLYTWTVYNALSVTEHTAITQDLCFTFLSSGLYTVELVVFNGNGCENITEQTIDVEVNELVIACPASQFGAQADPANGCLYDHLILPITILNGGVGLSTTTVTVDGIPSNIGAVVPIGVGSHTIIYNYVDECGEATCTTQIFVECEDEVSEQCGWMVMTCVGTLDDPITGGLYDTRYNSNAPIGEDWNNNVLGTGRISKVNPAMWNINDVGQVFGIALDDLNGMVYLAATDIYEYDDIWNYFNGTAVGPAGTAGIYSTDFISNVNVTSPITSTINSAGGNVIGTKMIPNTGGLGNGIGNIAFDERHNQLYATNLEDGRIYRVSPSGVVLSVFDPFALDNGISVGMAPLDEQLWAVGVLDNGTSNTVYFSRQRVGVSEVWSIDIDATGEFIASQSTPGIFDDSASSSVLQVSNIANVEARVTDIAFSHSGRMLLAERGHPHLASTFEYVRIGGVWIPGNDFYTGQYAGNNTAGGVDYGARESDEVVNDMCDDIVWSSINYARPLQTNNTVYGVQGKDAIGNSSLDATRSANDLYIDADGLYGTQDKSSIGDVELFNCGCIPQSENCDSLMVMAESIVNPNGEELCCYSIDIKNNFGPEIVELEVEMLTPEWIFNTTTLGAPFTFGACGSLNNKFCVQDATSGSIPSGTSIDAISTCFAPVVSNPTTQPIVEFKWKKLIGDEEVIVSCRDTLDFFCELPPPIDTCLVIASDTIRCLGADNPLAYEYCFTLTNKSGQDVDQIVLDCLSPGFSFLSLGTSSTIVFPVPSPLPDQATSAQICVQVGSNTPITSPQNFCMKMGLIAADGSDCCHSPIEVCIEIEPCCNPCEDKSVTWNKLDEGEDECCYSIDITNECVMPYFTKIEAVVNTPGVCFGSHVMGAAHAGNWLVTSSAQSICMVPVGGVIDQSSYQDLFSFCLDKIDDPSQVNPSITINWYAIDPITGEQVIVCEDTEETECPVINNDCVIISDGDLVCVPDSNKYRYTFKVKNVSNPGFTADRLQLVNKNDPAWQPVPSGPVIVLSPPLASGDSRIITTCIAGPAFPAPFPNFVFGYRLQNILDGDCCFESVCDTIPVPVCEDCCDEERLDFELDNYLNTLLVNNCKVSFGPVELDTCVALTINWGDGTGDSYDMDSTACKVYDQSGAFNVCVQFEVYPEIGDFPCYQKDTCLTIEIVDCPSECFSVIDIEAKEVMCDTVDCYESPFCQSWLVNKIAGLGCVGNFFLPYVQKSNYLGTTVFTIHYPNIEGETIEVYDCGGTLLQSCSPTGGGGINCIPFAGIDTNTDLTNQQVIWQCGDPLPTLNNNCNSAMSVEYCVKIMNLGSSDADKVTLNPILPVRASIIPSVITGTIPSGGMSTLTFTVSGPLVPGVDTKIDAQFMGVGPNGMEWMCNDTICLPTPTCPPPPEECCQDEQAFDALVAQGLQITDLGDCTYQVCANQFDDCHWFWTASPVWGDGTIVLPSLTQSDAPNNCWTHTYTTQGPHIIILNVEEQNAVGEACWNGQMQAEVACIIDICCDDYELDDLTSDIQTAIASINQQGCEICLTGDFPECVEWSIDWGNGGNINELLNGQATRCETYTDGIYTICIIGRVFDDNGDICFEYQECIDVEVEGCPLDCCDGVTEEEYDDLFNNVIDFDFDEDDCEVCFNTSGEVCDSITIDFGNGTMVGPISGASDDICYTYLVNGTYTVCVDMWRKDAMGEICFERDSCFVLEIDCEEVPPPVCAECTDGQEQGPNLVINGDFENLNTGFVSGLTFVNSPLSMSAGEYGVRMNPNMGNWFWDNPNPTKFLQVDGQANSVLWSQPVDVIAGLDYVFCAEFDNLVDPSKLLEITSPTVSVRIDGVVIPSLANIPITQLPDAIVSVTSNWPSTLTGTYLLDIIMVNTGTFGDIAIDNISFAQCGGCDIEGDPCEFTDITIAQIDDQCCYEVSFDNQYCDNYFKGFKVTTSGSSSVSQIQVQSGWFVNQINQFEAEVYPVGNFPMGSGVAFVICAQSGSNSLDFTVSWLIPTPDGCEEICSQNFSETCDDNPPVGCILIVDDIIDCNQYCFRVTNNTSPGFTISSIVLDQLTPAGTIINPNPISIPPLAPDSTSSIICVDYYNLLPGDTFCYNVIAHKEDITQGEIPTWCCTDTLQKCATVPDDCSPCDDLSIITTSAASGDTCCWAVDIINNYHNASFVGIKAKVLTTGAYFANINTTPDWTLQYIAADEYVFEYTDGTGFIPLGSNVTGDFCLTGYTTGLQQVEFSWLQLDPITGDTIEVCPIVIDSDCPAPPPPIACTDISDVTIDCVDTLGNYIMQFNLTNNTHLFGSGYNALSYHISNVTSTGGLLLSPISNNLVPVLMPGQTTTTPEIVNITGAVPGDTLCFSITLHDQLTGGGFNNCCTADTTWCFVIPSDGPCNMDSTLCCDNYTLSDLQNDAALALSTYQSTDCEVCVDGDFPDCVNWSMDWGDGSAAISTSMGMDTWCYEYDSPGTYTACLISYVLDAAGDTCLVNTECLDIEPNCVCCGISDADYNDLFSDLIDFDQDTCNAVCFNLDGEDCDLVTIDFGYGTSIGPVSGNGDEQCHTYSTDGTYNICVNMYRPDDMDSSINCMERDTCFDIVITEECTDLVSPCDPSTWDIPNGLTPNGDGFNEVLKFYNFDDCTANIKVYNRWGQMVYNKNGYMVEWFGQSDNGEPLPDGTYYILIGTDSKRDGTFDNFITRYIDLRRE